MSVLKNHNEACFHLGKLAIKSMLFEVSATPKPGLVDRNNSGAHKDMDFFSFMSSSSQLMDTFYLCGSEGFKFEANNYKELLNKIRPIGIQGEQNMFRATNNVNTHKGLIFSLGIICAAAGNIYRDKRVNTINSEEVCNRVKEITEGISHKELGKSDKNKKLTYGEELFRKYGVKGIRGEVESGFKTVRTISLPLFKELIMKKEPHINDILVQVLIHLMSNTEDCNVLGRHDIKMLAYVRNEAKKAIELGGIFSKEGRKHINRMDKDFIEKNISPGGSADLLAVTIMLYMLEKGEKL